MSEWQTSETVHQAQPQTAGTEGPKMALERGPHLFNKRNEEFILRPTTGRKVDGSWKKATRELWRGSEVVLVKGLLFLNPSQALLMLQWRHLINTKLHLELIRVASHSLPLFLTFKSVNKIEAGKTWEEHSATGELVWNISGFQQQWGLFNKFKSLSLHKFKYLLKQLS